MLTLYAAAVAQASVKRIDLCTNLELFDDFLTGYGSSEPRLCLRTVQVFAKRSWAVPLGGVPTPAHPEPRHCQGSKKQNSAPGSLLRQLWPGGHHSCSPASPQVPCMPLKPSLQSVFPLPSFSHVLCSLHAIDTLPITLLSFSFFPFQSSSSATNHFTH